MFTRNLILALVFLAPIAMWAQTAQPAPEPERLVAIGIDGPVYAGQPVWLRADLGQMQMIRYPFSESASDLGCNQIKVKRDGVLLVPATVPGMNMSLNGVVCGSAAPRGSPVNRLPLHILYPLTEPGKYSVRLTMKRPDFRSSPPMKTVAQSDWLEFEVLLSTPEQHEAWLKNLLSNPPEDAGQLAGDFLPSLIAAAPDQRALNMLVKYLHWPDLMVSRLAASCLEVFPQTVVLPAVVETLVKDGPSEELAQFATMHRGWTLEDENRIVHATIPYLLSLSPMQPAGRLPAYAQPTQSAAALKLLGYIFYVRNHAWPENDELHAYADAEVLKAAPRIMTIGNVETVRQLAVVLGEMEYSLRGHEFLMEIAQRTDGAAEQARIGLTRQLHSK